MQDVAAYVHLLEAEVGAFLDGAALVGLAVGAQVKQPEVELRQALEGPQLPGSGHSAFS